MGIDRRRFLRLSALAAAPLVARPAPAAPQAEPRGQAADPIVVVGAGLAGLRAADLLRRAGRAVVVLEARPSPGGRVQTVRRPFDNGLFAEAGPIRIAGLHQAVLGAVRDFGLSLVPFDSSNGAPLITLGRTNVRADQLAGTPLPLDLEPDERGLTQGALLDRYVGDLPADLALPAPDGGSYARWQGYDRVTWHEWLRSRGASPGAIRLMTLGGESSELSALYVLRQFALLRRTTQFYKVQGGMDRLPRAMAAALGGIVRYNAAVVRLDRSSSSSIRVDFIERDRMKSLRAGHVILAIPLSTLREIEIRPAFSRQKERIVEELPYFPATRFLVQSRRRFWHQSGLNGYARTDQPAEIWDCTYDLGGTPGILGATVGGATSRATLEMTPERCVRFGRHLVAAAFPEIESNFQKGMAHRWALEPWSRGAFAVFHPGQMAAMMPDISRPDDRVHFAGEHTSAWMGWMEGALESGERAAREILN